MKETAGKYIYKNTVLIVLISLISLVFTISFVNVGRGASNEIISSYTNNNIASMDEVFENYLQNKKDSSEMWITFMSILATFFAVFFVYTGFRIETVKEKIEDAKDKVDGAEKKVSEIEKTIQEDIYEYAMQLQYCMSYIIQGEYGKAIDALTVLRNERCVLKDNNKINTCCFFLAHCYYEMGIRESNNQRKREDIALAIEYIDQAIKDPMHPLRNEIIDAFNLLDKNYEQKTSLGISQV